MNMMDAENKKLSSEMQEINEYYEELTKGSRNVLSKGLWQYL